MASNYSARVLLDTNIVSYFFKNHALAELYDRHVRGTLPAITLITVGELYLWSQDARWGSQRIDEMERYLRRFLILPFDHEVAREYGRTVAERKRCGRPLSANDGWIAATALRHGVPLITHNSRDFASIPNLQLITENV